MVYCFVCNHCSGMRKCSFYKFPENSKENLKWRNLIRDYNPLFPSKWSYMCSCHFEGGNVMNGPTIFDQSSIDNMYGLGRCSGLGIEVVDNSGMHRSWLQEDNNIVVDDDSNKPMYCSNATRYIPGNSINNQTTRRQLLQKSVFDSFIISRNTELVNREFAKAFY